MKLVRPFGSFQGQWKWPSVEVTTPPARHWRWRVSPHTCVERPAGRLGKAGISSSGGGALMLWSDLLGGGGNCGTAHELRCRRRSAWHCVGHRVEKGSLDVIGQDWYRAILGIGTWPVLSPGSFAEETYLYAVNRNQFYRVLGCLEVDKFSEP